MPGSLKIWCEFCCLKRPAVTQGGSQPKKKAREPGKLTAEAWENHKKFIQVVEEKAKNGRIDQEGFEEVLGQLDPSVSQALWKGFEQSRKACGQEELYKNECNGVGGTKKKRQLLRAWIMEKQSCGQTCRQSQHTMGLLKTQGVKEKHMTKEETLTKWGKDELAQRLASGTIYARRCPQDKRFWEFQSVTQQGSCMAQSNKITSLLNFTSLPLISWVLVALSSLDSNSQALGLASDLCLVWILDPMCFGQVIRGALCSSSSGL